MASSAHSAPASDRERILDRRRALLGPSYRYFYEKPVHLVRGATLGWWIGNGGWDGSRYLHAVDGKFRVFDGKDGSPLLSAHPLGDRVVDVVYSLLNPRIRVAGAAR